ncbi:MAG: ATP-dependent helicase [Anaerolineales bacterium]|nr:ATP-dependent helicase [Anaerolineales bacterium]
MSSYQPRPSQEKILSYRQGTMGVAAVPGSGKTWTLSRLAAELIDQNNLKEDQEILVVTLVNSAVNNFAQRIGAFLSDRNLIPSLGYRVRTLHGLAHDILRERPELVGLDTQFNILDEREAERIRRKAVEKYLHQQPHCLDGYLLDDLDEKKRDRIISDQLPELLYQFSVQFIRSAKDLALTPDQIRTLMEKKPGPRLVDLGLSLYEEYQSSLAYRGAVDFDDLIRLAYQALRQDSAYLARLRNQWPFILEDEAQDSSVMQEKILSLLAGEPGNQNWVRVGDPNQAIYETFTTANPQLLLDFIQSAEHSHSLPNSGRSTQSIINLANYLVVWVNKNHPSSAIKGALAANTILPTPPGDSQPNPPDKPEKIHLAENDFSPRAEIQSVCKSAASWIKEHPEKTAAILVPRNTRGKEVASHLRRAHKLEPIEQLNSTLSTRQTAGALGNILSYLENPARANQLAKIYRVWRRADREKPEVWESVQRTSRLISKCKHPESFIYPDPGEDWLENLPDISGADLNSMKKFRQLIRRWQEAVLLPIDQLVLTLSNDLFDSTVELAIAHKLAHYLGQLADNHPEWELPALTDELRVVARNERRFFSFTSDTGFDPDKHKGQIVVTTIHKSKGLEWDRVYVMAVNNYNFPSGEPYDSFIFEKWFIRDQLNIPAEGTAQLKRLISSSDSAAQEEGAASSQARTEYIRERLRLLYVAVTRAREELVITWNTGRRGQSHPALPLVALQEYWKSERN